MNTRRVGLGALAAGLAVIAAAQVLAPVHAPPLYDGVVVEEPYRYLSPAAGEAGEPGSYAGVQPIDGGASPAFAAATSESPPQAQLIAQSGAFAPPAGTSELAVAITPLPPTPPDAIVGNAYRFSVADGGGLAVPVASGSFVTLALRAPAGSTDVTIVRSGDGAWAAVPTLRGGQPDVFLANVDALGDFAIRGTAAAGGSGLGDWPRLVGIAAAIGAVLVGVALLRPRRSPARDPALGRHAGSGDDRRNGRGPRNPSR